MNRRCSFVPSRHLDKEHTKASVTHEKERGGAAGSYIIQHGTCTLISMPLDEDAVVVRLPLPSGTASPIEFDGIAPLSRAAWVACLMLSAVLGA